MSLSGKEIQTLRSELSDDPLTKGYSGMSDQEAADDINDVNRTVDRETVTSCQMQSEVVGTEHTALTQAKRDVWISILCDSVSIDNTNIRNQIKEIWGVGTATRSNLAALQTKTVSRATELGIGKVKIGDVQQGRM